MLLIECSLSKCKLGASEGEWFNIWLLQYCIRIKVTDFFFLHGAFLLWPYFYFGGQGSYVKVSLSC